MFKSIYMDGQNHEKYFEKVSIRNLNTSVFLQHTIEYLHIC